jgi:hypothetical protein
MMIDDDTRAIFEKHGYSNLKVLANGELAGVQMFLFTYGLTVGLGFIGYRTRFCYHTKSEAVEALRQWDGTGDPPGLWIKQKPEDRSRVPDQFEIARNETKRIGS